MRGGFTPGGRTHRILARLARRDAEFLDLAAAIGLQSPLSEAKRKKLWRLLDELMVRRLIWRDPANRRLFILPPGETQRAALDTALGGPPPPLPAEPEPSVRLFARPAP